MTSSIKNLRKLIVFTDGGAISNPGPSAGAFLICDEKGNVLKEYKDFFGEGTNNEAEYKSAIFALKKIKSLLGKKKIKEVEVEIRSDSRLLVDQQEGRYKILNPRIRDLFLDLWNLKIDFKKVSFKLIPREDNKRADKLVKEVLEENKKP